ncbi:MAG TPA: cytochrome b [Rhizomicrobium sp.]|jgi:cytochrome b561
MPSHNRYTRTAVLFHWLIAALLLIEVAQGWWMQEIPKQPPGLRADQFNLHKSFGLVLLALILARLGWRLLYAPPPMQGVARWQLRLAKTNHTILYLAMLALPLSGYLGSVFSGYPIKWFGVTLPAWGSANPAVKDLMSTMHWTVSWILVASTLLHVAGAFKHEMAGQHVLARMAWRRRARRAGRTSLATPPP